MKGWSRGGRSLREGVRLACLGLAVVGWSAGLGVSSARGDGDHGEHAAMPTGSPTGEAGPVKKGRQLCSYRPGVAKPALCGTKAQIRPAPPLRGKMLMFEANSFTGVAPTPAQQGAADEMVAACEASAKRHGWDKIDRALADGYEPSWNDSVHYINSAYVFDDALLDCDKPEYLMYYDSPDSPSGKVLAGIMFITQALLDEGPQFGGSLTRWHYHYWSTPRCLRDGLMAIGVTSQGDCEEGEPSFRGVEMLHVWLFDHPAGRFSSMMHLPDESLQKLIQHRGTAATP